jgi:hypothetical protein
MRKILLVFGLLAVFVFLFIPYRSIHVKFKVDPHSLAKYKMTTHQSGYMFVLEYLKQKSNRRSERSGPGTEQGADQNSYFLNKTLFLIEVIILIVLAPLDYVLFCIILKQRKL